MANPINLTDAQKIDICAQLAVFQSPKVIQAELLKKHGRKVNEATISGYLHSKRWAPIIDKYREQYLREIGKVPISHERVRFERLEKTYQELEAEVCTSKDDRRKVRQDKLAVLREAREEVARAEAKGHTTNILAIQFQNMNDTELMQAKQQLLDRIQTIGGSHGQRTEGRLGEKVVECEVRDVEGDTGGGHSADV